MALYTYNCALLRPNITKARPKTPDVNSFFSSSHKKVNLDFKKTDSATPSLLNNLVNVIRQDTVINNISPNSDVSNSSLNLNYSSLIINPMRLSFENSVALKQNEAPKTTHQLAEALKPPTQTQVAQQLQPPPHPTSKID